MVLAETCDEAPFLRCISGNCSCTNAIDVYEEERRQCSTPGGYACKETSECVTNAICKGHPAGKDFLGRCICREAFTLQQNGTCGVKVPVGSVEAD